MEKKRKMSKKRIVEEDIIEIKRSTDLYTRFRGAHECDTKSTL